MYESVSVRVEFEYEYEYEYEYECSFIHRPCAFPIPRLSFPFLSFSFLFSIHLTYLGNIT